MICELISLTIISSNRYFYDWNMVQPNWTQFKRVMDKSVDWTKLTVRQENEKILILQQYWKLHKLSDGDLKECFKKILSIYKGQVPKEREVIFKLMLLNRLLFSTETLTNSSNAGRAILGSNAYAIAASAPEMTWPLTIEPNKRIKLTGVSIGFAGHYPDPLSELELLASFCKRRTQFFQDK